MNNKKNKNTKNKTASAAKTKAVTRRLPGFRDDRQSKKAAPSAKAKPVTKRQPGLRDDSAAPKNAPAAIAEPIRKRRGGLHDAGDAKAKTVRQVRAEFLSDTFMPKMTLAYKTITFNMACVNLFPDNLYVTISIDESNLRLIVEPATCHARNYLKFANFKNNRNVPRTCNIKYFCLMLFEFMNWNQNAKYRILTVYQEFDDKKYLVFNLDEAQQVFSEIIEGEDGKKKRNTTVQMPLDWKERFGYTMDELDDKTRLKFSNTLLTIDPKTGAKEVGIEPKPPTAEELMHEPYGGIRPRKEPKAKR